MTPPLLLQTLAFAKVEICAVGLTSGSRAMISTAITDREIAILCDVAERHAGFFNARRERFLINSLAGDLSSGLIETQNSYSAARLGNF